MSPPIIAIERLAKAYRIGRREAVPDTLLGAVAAWARRPVRNMRNLRGLDTLSMATDETETRDVFWALRDVSFEVQPGEVVGVIGRNGAGKSTLLKILSRITEPTRGRAVIRGRVASLLEVGTGFHPELTGRENVYMNGTILGMTKREIDRRFDEIVEFSGVETFLDTPVKRYSSGMTVRLAFAVAAHLDPEILIVDEVLAVGDAAYQRRCLDRMSDLARSGRTILFVSHNMDLVPKLCTKAVFLEQGTVKSSGPVQPVIQDYFRACAGDDQTSDLANKHHSGDGRARFTRLELVDAKGKVIHSHVTGDDLMLRVTIDSRTELRDVALAANINTLSGTKIFNAWSRELNNSIDLGSGINLFHCRFDSLALRPGHRFMIGLWMEAGEVVDCVMEAVQFDVLPSASTTNVSCHPRHSTVLCSAAWRRVY